MIHGEDPELAARRERERAWAEALVTVGQAMTTLGLRLRELNDSKEARPRATRPGTAPAPTLAGGGRSHGGLGPRQRQLLSLPGLDAPTGLSPIEVGTALNVARANAHRDLKRLAELGFLVAVPDERPARWRRAPHN